MVLFVCHSQNGPCSQFLQLPSSFKRESIEKKKNFLTITLKLLFIITNFLDICFKCIRVYLLYYDFVSLSLQFIVNIPYVCVCSWWSSLETLTSWLLRMCWCLFVRLFSCSKTCAPWWLAVCSMSSPPSRPWSESLWGEVLCVCGHWFYFLFGVSQEDSKVCVRLGRSALCVCSLILLFIQGFSGVQ